MIRRVAFGKAVLAGTLGALAWELTVRLLILLGVPLFDLVYVLGTMVVGKITPWGWWPVGMALHVMIGSIWAIFYAYFFWSAFDWPPAAQGVLFSLGPAILAGLVVMPQVGLMHAMVLHGDMPAPGIFGLNLGWRGPAGNLLGHLIYGGVMGSLYTRPVGYATAVGARRE